MNMKKNKNSRGKRQVKIYSILYFVVLISMLACFALTDFNFLCLIFPILLGVIYWFGAKAQEKYENLSK